MAKHDKSNDKNGNDANGSGREATGGGKARGRMPIDTSKLSETVRETRDRVTTGAQDALRKTGDAFDANPFAGVAGGLAVGAIAAALIPPTRQEIETLGPLSERIREGAQEAFRAAKEAGSSELTLAGLTAAASTGGLPGVVQTVVKIVTNAAGSAVTTARKSTHATTASNGTTTGASAGDLTTNDVNASSGSAQTSDARVGAGV